MPYPYGGKQRQVEVDLNPGELQSRGLSPVDVVNAIAAQNLILPAGTAKIGTFEYQVGMNGSAQTIQDLNDLPIETVNNSTTYIKDVANVRDGNPPQTNIVRVNGAALRAHGGPEVGQCLDARHHLQRQSGSSRNSFPGCHRS